MINLLQLDFDTRTIFTVGVLKITSVILMMHWTLRIERHVTMNWAHRVAAVTVLNVLFTYWICGEFGDKSGALLVATLEMILMLVSFSMHAYGLSRTYTGEPRLKLSSYQQIGGYWMLLYLQVSTLLYWLFYRHLHLMFSF